MCAMRRIDAIDHARGDDGVQIFGVPVLLGGGLARAHPPPARSASPRTSQPASSSVAHDRRKMRGGARRDRPAGFRRRRRCRCGASWRSAAISRAMRTIRIAIDVHVAVALEMADHRHARLLLHALDQALAAARHDDVDVVRSCPPACSRRPRDRWSARAGCSLAAAPPRAVPPRGRHGWRGWSAALGARRAGSTALPDFRHSAPASAVTFGRLS